MKRHPRILALILAACAVTAGNCAATDLTISGRSTLVALNRPTSGQETLYLTKQRLRRDVTTAGRSYTHLYDLKRREVTAIDHWLRQAQVHKLEGKEGDGDQVIGKDIKLTLHPTGGKHDLMHWDCAEHEVKASMPLVMGQEQATMLLEGRIWLAGNAREQRTFAPFVKAVGAEDFFISAPPQGGTANAQAEGLGELLRRVLPKGMLCAADVQFGYEGNGPMINLARRMAMRISIVYESLSSVQLEDTLFEIPQGYQVLRGN